MAAKTRRYVPRWVPAVAGVAATLAVIITPFLRTRVELPPVLTPMVTAASVPDPVLGAPYSAMITNESIQTLADGNGIVQNEHGNHYTRFARPHAPEYDTNCFLRSYPY